MTGCNISIDHQALFDNLARVKTLAPSSNIVAMIKANAYGHGAVAIAKALEGQVAYFGVARMGEAIALRQSGIKSKILLAEGFLSPKELGDIALHNIAVVVHAPWQVKEILRKQTKMPLDIWLKYDSGMHRLGFDEWAFSAALDKLKTCVWVQSDIKLMTHFATADEPSHPLFETQLQRFKTLSQQYPELPTSAGNSAALFQLSPHRFDYVRPGLMLYGASPFTAKTAKQLNLKPVMQFISTIIAVRECHEGESVGYGATWVAAKPTRIATVAAGYADGYPRHINQQAYALVDGTACPIVGRVSMDMLTIDVTHLKEVTIGMPVTLWGDGLPVDEVAAFSNTIAYDLLCRTGLRVFR